MLSEEKSRTSPPIKRQAQLGIFAPESFSNQEMSTSFSYGAGVSRSLFSEKEKNSSDLNCKYPSNVFVLTSVDKSILSPVLSFILNTVI